MWCYNRGESEDTMNCETCKAKLPTLKTRLTRVNDALHQLGLELWTSVPYHRIDTALEANVFNAPTYGAGTTQDRTHEEVGDGKWLTLSLYRHESGRYE